MPLTHPRTSDNLGVQLMEALYTAIRKRGLKKGLEEGVKQWLDFTKRVRCSSFSKQTTITMDASQSRDANVC